VEFLNVSFSGFDDIEGLGNVLEKHLSFPSQLDLFCASPKKLCLHLLFQGFDGLANS
jgi:hypothetical protein